MKNQKQDKDFTQSYEYVAGFYYFALSSREGEFWNTIVLPFIIDALGMYN